MVDFPIVKNTNMLSWLISHFICF